MNAMLTNLADNNFAAVDSDLVPPKWTNNNSESFNHVIRSLKNYTPDKLPGVVQTIKEVYNRQHVQELQALYGQGEFL